MEGTPPLGPFELFPESFEDIEGLLIQGHERFAPLAVIHAEIIFPFADGSVTSVGR